VNTQLEMVTTTTTTVAETMEVARPDPAPRPTAGRSETPIQETSTEEAVSAVSAVLVVPRLAVTLTITFTGIEGTITVSEEDSATMEALDTTVATIMDTTTTTTMAGTGAPTTVTAQERTSAATSTGPTTVLNPTLDNSNLSH